MIILHKNKFNWCQPTLLFILLIVVRKFKEPRIELAPAKCKEKIKQSTEEF
jgi:hypothetical protein